MKNALYFFVSCIALVLVSCAHQSMPKPPFSSYRVIFTSGLTESDEPIDQRDRFSLNDDAIYVFITWFDVDQIAHPYRIEFRDASGQLVMVDNMNFRPTEDSWNTWSWYKFKENVDEPGKWQVTVYLFGEVVYENLIQVDHAQSGT